MGLSALHRVDISYVDADNIVNLLLVAGAGWSHQREALQYVQLIYKLQNIIEYAREMKDKKVVIGLVNAQQPPLSVLQYVRDRDVMATVGIGDENASVVVGKPALFPNLANGEPDLLSLQNANAAIFAEKNNLSLSPSIEDILLLDDILAARRSADPDEEQVEDGDLQILAGAYAGRFLLTALGGHWVFSPDDPMMDVIHLMVGERKKLGVNMISKVGKFLQQGRSESIAAMARSIIAMAEERA